MFVQGKYLLNVFVKITHIPQDLLTAILVVICCAGAFAIGSSEMDVYVMLAFGVIAYFMQKVAFASGTHCARHGSGPYGRSKLEKLTGYVRRFLEYFCQETDLPGIYYPDLCADLPVKEGGMQSRERQLTSL